MHQAILGRQVHRDQFWQSLMQRGDDHVAGQIDELPLVLPGRIGRRRHAQIDLKRLRDGHHLGPGRIERRACVNPVQQEAKVDRHPLRHLPGHVFIEALDELA